MPIVEDKKPDLVEQPIRWLGTLKRVIRQRQIASWFSSEKRSTLMCIEDCPSTSFPEGVNSKQQYRFSIDFIEATIDGGLCETCHNAMATAIFNIGKTHHHLCKPCFDEMMTIFQERKEKEGN